MLHSSMIDDRSRLQRRLSDQLRRKKAREENLILIKVHDYIDNYSGEITAFGASRHDATGENQ